MLSTNEGLGSVAKQRRQMLVERFLVDVVGIPWSEAHGEAELMVTAVSDRVEQRLVDLLSDPGTCPHGNPIPGSRNRPDQSRALPLDQVTGPVWVTRVAEALEEDIDAMRRLEACGLIPGNVAEVSGSRGGGTHVVASIQDAVIAEDIAPFVHVTPFD